MIQHPIFISGIDTGIGKTVVTALLAHYLQSTGESVITQKIVQTGGTGISEDILFHRKIMQCETTPEDIAGITCPYVFDFPASPHLSAKLENRHINMLDIDTSTISLQNKYKYVLIEGVGGLCVPLTSDFTLLDYLSRKDYSILLVTSSKLGSINHTLLSLEAARHKNLNIAGLIYKHLPNETIEIAVDTVNVFAGYLTKLGYNNNILELPYIDFDVHNVADFSAAIEKFLAGVI